MEIPWKSFDKHRIKQPWPYDSLNYLYCWKKELRNACVSFCTLSKEVTYKHLFQWILTITNYFYRYVNQYSNNINDCQKFATGCVSLFMGDSALTNQIRDVTDYVLTSTGQSCKYIVKLCATPSNIHKWIKHFCQDISKTSGYFSKIWVWSVDLMSWQGLCWILLCFTNFDGHQTLLLNFRCKITCHTL